MEILILVDRCIEIIMSKTKMKRIGLVIPYFRINGFRQFYAVFGAYFLKSLPIRIKKASCVSFLRISLTYTCRRRKAVHVTLSHVRRLSLPNYFTVNL